jgi:hypothetical protein
VRKPQDLALFHVLVFIFYFLNFVFLTVSAAVFACASMVSSGPVGQPSNDDVERVAYSALPLRQRPFCASRSGHLLAVSVRRCCGCLQVSPGGVVASGFICGTIGLGALCYGAIGRQAGNGHWLGPHQPHSKLTHYFCTAQHSAVNFFDQGW